MPARILLLPRRVLFYPSLNGSTSGDKINFNWNGYKTKFSHATTSFQMPFLLNRASITFLSKFEMHCISIEVFLLQTEELDISGNQFTTIPANISELHQLQILNLSQNSISTLDSAALKGLERLKVLDLSRNLFENWGDIQNGSLIGATSLSELDLSHNSLRGFPDLGQQPPLRSDTLEILRLSNCSIANILGDILDGLPALVHLDLRKNSINALNAQIKSDSLRSLDLSECGLQRIHPEAFLEMPALESLTLLKNYQLKKWISRSYSLANLDISECNFERLPSVHLPNLTKINLRGNHIRKLGVYEFSIYPLLQWLDLSSNAIQDIDETAFAALKFLRTIDLSFNTIYKVSPETFSKNTRLVRLNLSQNYLRTLEQFAIKSLETLDVSVCEIQNIAKDCLVMMPKLYVLNMSRNLLSHIPGNLQGPKVAYLDLSLCHISSLNNETFSAMPNLVKLSLQGKHFSHSLVSKPYQYSVVSGNRLTSGIKASFFPNRAHVDLGDNAWFCDCHSKDFRELYDWIFLQHNPGSGCCTSLDTLRCQAPENVAGLEWRDACSKEWYLHAVPPDQMWMFSLSFIMVMVLVFCLLISVKHAYNQRVMREIENQEQQREEERQRREQENQTRNSSDITENRYKCWEEKEEKEWELG